jgi:putative endonuclease
VIVDKLVYFEHFYFAESAIVREKQIKGYSRAKKNDLINTLYKEWVELYSNGKIQEPNKN